MELEREVARRIQAEESLAEANASLTSFAYIASHDLQEPLRKIRTVSVHRCMTVTQKLWEHTATNLLKK